jgi:uncharacterized protein YbaR (Trm112 family)
MHEILTGMLQCPACSGALDWDVQARTAGRIEEGVAHCTTCSSTYPILEGIGVFLTPDLPRNDLWEGVESGLTRFLRENPEIERRLLNTPLHDLNPADRFFRGMVLDERGDLDSAEAAYESAHAGMYTDEYRACVRGQIDHVVARTQDAPGPIVDLASGRGTLVEALAKRGSVIVVGSDFSPTVLRRDLRWLRRLGLDERVSLLAFDARRTPFRDGSIRTMTTFVGLGNIEDPGNVLRELRRVVDGAFFAVSAFYDETDEPNIAAARELGLSPLLCLGPTRERFEEAGWRVEVTNDCRSRAEPTPIGVTVEGASIDSLPVQPTTLQWCVLVAR